MGMNPLLTWLNMGGYAPYVWSAYGLVGIFLLIPFLGLRIQKKRTHASLVHWFKHISHESN